ncbi:ORF1305 [White spot syndrome virus]|uniref:Wsv501 n=3 Tax=White spot syndrome virus TaxID=342409 RepID=Q8VAC4_WSSVS|nr:wsv501 [Shrimp white spot syndrome virus]AFX59863.1 wsv501 [White spot syndrome virus]AAL33502.1 wsv501 [Shrimp white spot syndrome virus]AAL88894.1 WSSV026 [Shrimp white spot syndrome virus]ATU83704.1 ORF1305 [White spot syndrome virus]AWQ60598.1 wsv501 [Shrimp white spot syndrome virus]
MDHSRAFACIRLPGTSQARGWNVWIIIELFHRHVEARHRTVSRIKNWIEGVFGDVWRRIQSMCRRVGQIQASFPCDGLQGRRCQENGTNYSRIE